MGSVCFSQSALHNNINQLPNKVPPGQQYIFYESHSVRFSEVNVTRNNNQKLNEYKFVMKLSNSTQTNNTINVNLVIINEKIHRLFTDNYDLKIQKRMIIDIFDKKLSSTLVEVKNERSGLQFSLQVFPFRGYTSQSFKKCLYTLYILKRKLPQIENNHLFYHKSIDSFVYGCNPDRQALTLLYQKAQTSLANIAEYRMLANWPWTIEQKLKIFTDIMDAVYFLHKNNINHRDIRPSNIFFIERLGRYVIGNFTKSIQINQDYDDEMNRTVYGLQYTFLKQQGCQRKDLQRIGNYIKQKKQFAPYSSKNLDYHGLLTILQILQTQNIFNLQHRFNDKVMLSIYNQFIHIFDIPFYQVRQKIHKITSKYDIQHLKLIQDLQISNFISKLTYYSHKSTIQQYTFQIYDILGYQKQFSDTTHYLIQKNNQKNKSLQNAYLLKNLGEFFERNGAKGTQYYCNACLLFLKRAQRQLNLGNLHLTQEDYNQAQKCYIKFSQNFESHSSYIQLNRINALIKLKQNQRDPSRALEIIKETFQYAAKKKISIEKQMTLLLTFAVIHLHGDQSQKIFGEQKLKNGLAICQNKGAFQNNSSCNIHTSNFLYELGKLNLYKVRRKNIEKYAKDEVSSPTRISISILNIGVKPEDQQIIPQKAMAQSNLKACLQIRQRQRIQPIALAEVLKTLGQFYFEVDELNQGKKVLQRCQIILKQIQKQVNLLILIKTFYLFGSTLYGLKQFSQAEKKYQRAYDLFSGVTQPKYDLLKHNIQGNLGLSQIQINKKVGQKNVQEAKTFIKTLKGQNFFDYLFLNKKYRQIKGKSSKSLSHIS